MYLDIVLGKFFSKSSPARRRGVDGVVDGDLAVCVVQPRVNILAAALEDLLPQHYRCRRGIGEEVVLRHLASGDCCPAVVAEVKDASLDAQPRVTVRELHIDTHSSKGDKEDSSPLEIPRERDANVSAGEKSTRSTLNRLLSFPQIVCLEITTQHNSGECIRFATRRQSDHDDCDPARVEQPPRHCAVQLGRSHVVRVRGHIVDAVNKGGALAAVSWRVGRNLGRAVDVVSVDCL